MSKNIYFLLFLAILIPLEGLAQAENSTKRDSLIIVAKKLIKEAETCALITLDKTGHPQARTMDPFAPEEDMIIWLATNKFSGKVTEITNDNRVTIYYTAPKAVGYVTIQGLAYLIDDQGNKEEYWKEGWEAFYPKKEKTFQLIKVIPQTMEVVSYQHGFLGDTVTWAAPRIEFEKN